MMAKMSTEKSDSFELSNLPPSYTETFCLLDGQLNGESPPRSRNDTSRSQSSSAEFTLPELKYIIGPKDEAKIENLAWILMEILATTFSADVDRIKKSIMRCEGGRLNKFISKPGDSGLQSAALRETMRALCQLVRIYKEELQAGGTIGLDRFGKQYQEALEKFILEPCQRYGLDVGYVLEMLGRYRDSSGQQGDDYGGDDDDDQSIPKANNLVEYWTFQLAPPTPPPKKHKVSRFRKAVMKTLGFCNKGTKFELEKEQSNNENSRWIWETHWHRIAT
jgi:hypothetical protein